MPNSWTAEFLNVVDLILSMFKSLRLENFKGRLGFRDPANDTLAPDELGESPGAILVALAIGNWAWNI